MCYGVEVWGSWTSISLVSEVDMNQAKTYAQLRCAEETDAQQRVLSSKDGVLCMTIADKYMRDDVGVNNKDVIVKLAKATGLQFDREHAVISRGERVKKDKGDRLLQAKEEEEEFDAVDSDVEAAPVVGA